MLDSYSNLTKILDFFFSFQKECIPFYLSQIFLNLTHFLLLHLICPIPASPTVCLTSDSSAVLFLIQNLPGTLNSLGDNFK